MKSATNTKAHSGRSMAPMAIATASEMVPMSGNTEVGCTGTCCCGCTGMFA